MQSLKVLLIVLAAFLISGAAGAEEAPIHFSKNDRVLVVSPHPDDEMLGTGGVMLSALEAGADVKVIYLTHGDYNEIASIFFQKKLLLTTADFIKSGQVRKKEAISAMSVLGLAEKDLIFFGYPDLGTLGIWRGHWGQTKPFRSVITRINKVPYKDDFSYGWPYRGDNVVRDFEKIFSSVKPTHIFVTPPFDLNPDHRAAYLYVNAALLNLEGKIEKPNVFAYLIHAHRWPTPRKYKLTEPLKPPGAIQADTHLQWLSYDLTPRQMELKRNALLKYTSQAAYSRNFMLSFVRTNELFLRLPYENLNASPTNAVSDQQKAGKRSAPEKVTYWIQGDEFWVDVRDTSPLGELGAMTIEIFSYKNGVEFPTLPKLNLRLLGSRIFVRDGRRRVLGSGIQYDLGKKTLVIRVPLKLLKSPDYLFVSAQILRNDISLDFGSWRILKVNKDQTSFP
ncbi:MAG: hypothetical protein COT00_03685 [Candidatus Omnitrophica bacterium CG07_land_8_20_14_0_80_50_8]|nr:MAG: hypothetical protein AUJ71_01550 [Candidatus Omnitrophica bacterium CG1_02_49_16]PIU40056.1 MAG: hypothetical protein COT00_03685 [Candidatus Omnitrophica bacterium CG07_land_8_20_14_0_80_50_8]